VFSKTPQTQTSHNILWKNLLIGNNYHLSVIDTLLETAADEAMGAVCGLPPGTVTAAKALGVTAVASGSSSKSKPEVEKKTSGMNPKEKEIFTVAALNLAKTAKRDHPRVSDKRCLKFAVETLVVANEVYSPESMKGVILDSLRDSHRSHRKVMKTVKRDFIRGVN